MCMAITVLDMLSSKRVHHSQWNLFVQQYLKALTTSGVRAQGLLLLGCTCLKVFTYTCLCVLAAFMLHLWFDQRWVPPLQVRLYSVPPFEVFATCNGHLACHFVFLFFFVESTCTSINKTCWTSQTELSNSAPQSLSLLQQSRHVCIHFFNKQTYK